MRANPFVVIMVKEKIVFGKKEQNKNYSKRISIYALIFDDSNEKIAIIKTPTGYFLPGGGLEGNESHNQCLLREAKEEMGWEIEVKNYIGNSAGYHYSTTKQEYIYVDGYFYLAKMIKTIGNPTEPDHQILWLSYSEASKKLYHENQIWAVKKAIKDCKN